jgi:hypothetical protein
MDSDKLTTRASAADAPVAVSAHELLESRGYSDGADRIPAERSPFQISEARI